VFNFGYADAAGNVGYQCAGRIPVRQRVARGYRQANTPVDEWQGYVPFDALPSALNPGRGYVASANERVAADDYPYQLHGAWGSGFRAERIHQALGNRADVDRAYVIALQNDLKSRRAERLCPRLVEHFSESSEADVEQVRAILSTWDYRYTLDSVAPTIFETLMDVWQERVILEYFPARLSTLLHTQTGVPSRLIEHGDLEWFKEEDVHAELVAAAAYAMQQVHARFGSNPAGWQWGTVHRAHWRHPLSDADRRDFDIGPRPVDGGIETLRNTGLGQPGFSAASGAEYRLVVDFAEPQTFLAVQNIGNSGEPGHPHYADQFEDWLAGRYHTMSLRRADVERDLESSIVLQRSDSSVAAAAATGD